MPGLVENNNAGPKGAQGAEHPVPLTDSLQSSLKVMRVSPRSGCQKSKEIPV